MKRGLATIVVVMAAAASIALRAAEPLCAIAPSPSDDQLFLKWTASILDGQWLGTYNSLSLAKGSFFSLFAAGAHLIGAPLIVAEQAVYVLAAGAMSAAVWR